MSEINPTVTENLALHFYWAVGGEFCYQPYRHPWPLTPDQLDEERNSEEEWDRELAPLLKESQPLAPRLAGGTNFNSGSPYFWLYAITGAAAWHALAGVLKTYLTRRSGRKVTVYGDNDKKLLEVTGDLTTTEIEALLRARVAPPKLGGTSQSEESGAQGTGDNEGQGA